MFFASEKNPSGKVGKKQMAIGNTRIFDQSFNRGKFYDKSKALFNHF
jgi:hypothetical protein